MPSSTCWASCWTTSTPCRDWTVRPSSGTACSALPADLAARLAPSAGLRNVLVHQYAEIDLDQVVAAVSAARTDFRAYVRTIADGLAG